MSNDFLDNQILQPFAKADPFMPGSGLGLGLAQRIISMLGGSLAIKSDLRKGTLVHVEIPIHLLNDDNEADWDELDVVETSNDTWDSGRGERKAARAAASSDQPPDVSLQEDRKPSDSDESPAGERHNESVRHDGIYLIGFDAPSNLRRVGRSLMRQLKLHSCRITDEIHYASLIVSSSATLLSVLHQLASQARPDVQVIVLSQKGEPAIHTSAFSVPVRQYHRFLRPSVIRSIMRPPRVRPPAPETYISPIVGGESARPTTTSAAPSSRRNSHGSTATAVPNSLRRDTMTGSLEPSPPSSPSVQTSDLEGPASASRIEIMGSITEHEAEITGVPSMRPTLLHEQASDPLPTVQIARSSLAVPRPALKETVSTPDLTADPPSDGPIRGGCSLLVQNQV